MANEEPITDPVGDTTEAPAGEAAQPSPVPPATTDIVGGRGGLYPRWPFLAAIFIMPCAAVGYLVYAYYSTHTCSFGALCQLDSLPAFVQVLLIVLLFLVLWFLWLIFGIGGIENPLLDELSRDAPGYSPGAAFLRRISNFEPVRWLLVGYGGVVALGMLLVFLAGKMYPVLFVLSAIVVWIGFCVLVRAARGDTANLSAQQRVDRNAGRASRPMYVLRNMPVINRILPNRAN